MKTLVLYKTLLRSAQKLPSYNIRMYALRKIKSSFKDNMHLKDVKDIENKKNVALKNLELINRQIVVGNLYSPDKLIIEQLLIKT